MLGEDSRLELVWGIFRENPATLCFNRGEVSLSGDHNFCFSFQSKNWSREVIYYIKKRIPPATWFTLSGSVILKYTFNSLQ